MKRVMSILLALVMALSLTTGALAVGDGPSTYEDTSTVTITKEYNVTNEGTTSPAETFQFKIERESVSDAADGITKENMPMPTITESLEFSAGENNNKEITVKLPEYTSVGVYTYKIKETAGETAGVDYDKDAITLKVTVVQQGDELVRVVAIYNGNEKNKTNKPMFTNTYSAGSLNITKTEISILSSK